MGKKTKLTSGSGKHVSQRKATSGKASAGKPSGSRTPAGKPSEKKNFWEKKTPLQRTGIVFGCVFLLAALLILIVWTSLKSSVKPPDITGVPDDPDAVTPPAVSASIDDPQHTGEGDTTVSGRKDGVYTILLMGQNQGLTDVMMVANFDTKNSKIEVVSIPRDTYCNTISGNVKKINGAYNTGGETAEEKIDSVYEAVESIIGFRPDKYMLIGYDGFVKLVDIIGGVEFDVPANMYHKDDNGNVDINLKKGYQLLNGKQALGLVRTRHVYGDEDLGRIRTAQKFLSAAAKKAVATVSVDKIDDYVDVMVEYVKTDLTAGEMIWFLQQAMNVDMENDLNFHAPKAGEELDAPYIKGGSYVCLRADKWVQLINATINPYTRYIRVSDVDIYHPSYTPSDEYLPEGVEEDTTASASGSGSTSVKVTPKPAATPKPVTTSAKTTPAPKNTPAPKVTAEPKVTPTPKPSAEPSEEPSASEEPTEEPEESAQPEPSEEPNIEPSEEPVEPTEEPTPTPTPSEEPFVPATPEH